MRHHVVGKMLRKMAFDGIKRGDFFFLPAVYIKQTNKKPQLICCGACLEHGAGLVLPE